MLTSADSSKPYRGPSGEGKQMLPPHIKDENADSKNKRLPVSRPAKTTSTARAPHPDPPPKPRAAPPTGTVQLTEVICVNLLQSHPTLLHGGSSFPMGPDLKKGHHLSYFHHFLWQKA